MKTSRLLTSFLLLFLTILSLQANTLDGDENCVDLGIADCNTVQIDAIPDASTPFCCFAISITTNDPEVYTDLRITPIGSFTFNNISLISGWNSSSLDPDLIHIFPANGPIPATTVVPVSLCLSSYPSAPQQVLVELTDINGEVLCTKTVTLFCPKCIKLDYDELTCTSTGFSFDFDFTNIDDFAIEKLEVVSLSPSGTTVTAPLFFMPNIAIGQTELNNNFTFNPPTGATSITFAIRAIGFEGCCVCTSDLITLDLPDCCDEDPCENISTVLEERFEEDGQCCYSINIDNPCDENTFRGIRLTAFGGALRTTSTSLNWELVNITQTEVTWQPKASSGIPIGNTPNKINFCVGGVGTPPIFPTQINLAWLGFNNEVICESSFITECNENPNDCTTIDEQNIFCTPQGNYKMDWSIRNTSNFTATTINVINVFTNPPSGVISFVPNPQTNLNIPPNGVHTMPQLDITGLNPGDQIYLQIEMNDASIGGTFNSCFTDYIILTVPECPCTEPCEEYSFTTTPVEGEYCCYDIDIDVECEEMFYGIEFEVLGNPFLRSANAGQGWQIMDDPLVPTKKKVWSPRNGAPIPAGPTTDKINFCLGGIHTAADRPQTVIMRWLDINGEAVCSDILTFECDTIVPGDCVIIKRDSVECIEPGSFQYCFELENVGMFTGKNIKVHYLHSMPNTGIFTPSSINIPTNFMVGDVLSMPCIDITNLNSGDKFCFVISVYDDPGQLFNNCCHTDTICITMPDCCEPCDNVFANWRPNQELEGDCCYSVDLENTCDSLNFTGIKIETLGNAKIDASTPFGGNWDLFTNATLTEAVWTPKNGVPIPLGAITNAINYCLTDITNSPQQVKLSWLGANGTVVCDTIFESTCEIFDPCENPCDFKSFTVTPEDSVYCCYDIDLNIDCDTFYAIELESLGNPFIRRVNAGQGWQTMDDPLFPTKKKVWSPRNGAPIPTGTTTGKINFCLGGINDPADIPQTVIMRWLDINGNVVCTDTLTFECPEIPSGDCVIVNNDTITCVGPDHFRYCFDLINVGNFPGKYIKMHYLHSNPPTGIFNPPSVNQTVTSFDYMDTISMPCIDITNLKSGEDFCFVISVYDDPSASYNNCCHTDTICVTMPDCEPICDPCDNVFATLRPNQELEGDCCYSVDLENTCDSLNFTGIKIETLGNAKIDPYTFGGGWDLISNVTMTEAVWTPKNGVPIPLGSITNVINYCLTDITNSPQQVKLSWLGANGTVVCDTIFETTCEIVEPCDPCDNVSATWRPNQELEGDCCYTVDLENTCDSLNFTGIKIETLGNAKIDAHTFGGGWDLFSNVTMTEAIWTPKNGAPIPLGSITNVINYCLIDITNSPQQVKLSWLGANGSVVCDTVFETTCEIVEPCDPCDNVSATWRPNQELEGDCCYTIDLENTCDSLNFTGIKIETLGNAKIDPYTFGGGWDLISNVTMTEAVWTPKNGVPIPLGSITNVINYCLTDITSSPQQVKLSWLGANGVVVCDTIFESTCEVNGPCENPCDKVDYTISAVDSVYCCYDIDLNIECDSFFYGIEFEVLGNPFFGRVNAGQGWQIMDDLLFPTKKKVWSPRNGVPIPTGTTTEKINFCLGGITDPGDTTQTVIMRWLDINGVVVCTDTLTFKCPVILDGDCVIVNNDTITCVGPDHFRYCFDLINVGNFPGKYIKMHYLHSNPPTGIFNPPSVNQMVTSFNYLDTISMPCIDITNLKSGEDFCFVISVYDDPSAIYNNCCHTDTICVTMPECDNPCGEPCDNVSVNFKPNDELDGCCYTVDIDNPCDSNLFSGIKIETLGSYSLSSTSTPISGGWELFDVTLTEATWKPKFGAPIPIGTTSDIINYCLGGLDSPADIPQQVKLSWLGLNGEIICDTIFESHCDSIPYRNCSVIVEDTIICNSEGNYTYDWSVLNNSTFPATTIVINSVTTTGSGTISYTPSMVTGSFPVGHIEAMPPITVTGGNPGDQLCIQVAMHDNGPRGLFNCCYSDTICITLPDCCGEICDNVSVDFKPNDELGECCYTVDINNPCDSNLFSGIKIETLGSYSLSKTSTPLTGGWELFDVTLTEATWKPKFGAPIPLGTTSDIIHYCLGDIDYPLDSPQYVRLSWLGLNGEVLCDTTFQSNCIEDGNKCSVIVDDKIVCDSTGKYTYTWSVKNDSDFDATTIIINSVTTTGSGTISYTPSTVTGSFPMGHIEPMPPITVIGGSPGDQLCIRVSMHDNSPRGLFNCCYSDTVCITLPDCPPLPGSGCIELEESDIYCDNDEYFFNFRFKNLSGYPINGVTMQVTTPTTLGLAPSHWNFPPVINGGISNTLPTELLNASPGSQFCFKLLAHYETQDSINCCLGDTEYCFTIPECDYSCQDNIAQNGEFEQGTPTTGDQDIDKAADWDGIWSGGSSADFFNTSMTSLPGGAITPLPLSQGNFLGMWCFMTNANPIWREGAMNDLAYTVTENSGCYEISLKIACLTDISDTPSLSIFGVPVGAVSTGTPSTSIPINSNLFNGPAIALGSYLIPSNCDENFTTISIKFNSDMLPPGGIDRIFLTRTDGIYGGVFIAIDDICFTETECNGCDNLDWSSLTFQSFAMDTVDRECRYGVYPVDFGVQGSIDFDSYSISLFNNGLYEHVNKSADDTTTLQIPNNSDLQVKITAYKDVDGLLCSHDYYLDFKCELQTLVDAPEDGLAVNINPTLTDGKVNIEIQSNLTRSVSIQIFDINGRQLHNELYFKKKIEVSFKDQASGMYFIKIIDDRGKMAITRIVKQ